MKTPITVRFSDIDMAGHVHNSNYLSYFEQARIDFLTAITGPNWNWKKKGLLIGRIEVDYILPLYLRDKVYIETCCDHVGNKSFTLSYELFKEVDGKTLLCTKGRSILICMDFLEEKSVPIFKEWKNDLMTSISSIN
jgi:acyl-CoA thioester hydrolase